MGTSKRANTKVAREKDGKWAKGTPSPNPIGRPREGESWAGVLRWAGNLTGFEAAQVSPPELAAAFRRLGTLKLKEATSLRAFAALLFEPTSGLLNAVMDRTEGKLATPVANVTEDLLNELSKMGLTIDDIRRDTLAASLFRLAGVSIDAGQAPDDGDSPRETEG